MGNVSADQWRSALGELQLQVTPSIFEMYLQPLRLIPGPGCVLAAPNQFVKDWLDLRLRRVVQKTLRHIVGEPVEIEVRVVDRRELLQQAALGRNEAGGVTAIQAGELRKAGFVMLWHDLLKFYSPMIGPEGVGLWAELRSNVHGDNDGHPLAGYAWPGTRGLAEWYGVSRDYVSVRLNVLQSAKLLEWKTGRELIDLYELDKANGVPASRRSGFPADVLRRLLQNADASRLYTVHDPLELPDFCVCFGHTLVLVDGTVRFANFSGRILGRWQARVARIMDAQGVDELPPVAWIEMGLSSRSF